MIPATSTEIEYQIEVERLNRELESTTDPERYDQIKAEIESTTKAFRLERAQQIQAAEAERAHKKEIALKRYADDKKTLAEMPARLVAADQSLLAAVAKMYEKFAARTIIAQEWTFLVDSLNPEAVRLDQGEQFPPRDAALTAPCFESLFEMLERYARHRASIAKSANPRQEVSFEMMKEHALQFDKDGQVVNTKQQRKAEAQRVRLTPRVVVQ